MDDSELERKAVEELLKEANRGKVRAQTMGPTGWMKCPLGSANKRFLLNTLRSSALTRQSTSDTRTSERERGGRGFDRACERHNRTDCQKCDYKKDGSHRRFYSDAHGSSSRNRSSSRSRSPCASQKSKKTRSRSRSRSPGRESPSHVKKYTDRRKK